MRKSTVIPKTIVGKRLMILKREHNLTYDQMAEDLDISKSTFINWVSMYVFPSAQMIIDICKAYDVSADWLLGLSNERKKING